ncbi:MAG TPA: DoxX family protein [Gemmatimonadaceae bacterium]|jgi:putative oxidoreductase|nr:DoxX family protein [Gemmatimonadaceae bacterium]
MIERIGSPRQAQIALGLIRAVAGVIFFAHGYQKFFIMGLDGTTGFFTQLGVPLPGISAIVVASLELAGGALLAAGFMTRFIAILLAIDMATAILLFHSKHGFFVPMGVEFVTLLLASGIALAIAGPGAYSVDQRGAAS